MSRDICFVLRTLAFAAYTAAATTKTTITHRQQEQQHFDVPKGIMTTKARLLVLVNRLDHVEKKLMRKK
jgi:hypothetical protein